MADSQRPLGAEISHALKARGVEVIFGIPGVHNVEMYRGIEQAGLTHILARHEQGAGFMADGYARATGRPGVAFVITGPGLCNILTPLGQAYSDSVPILVISSCLDETAGRRGQLHQMKDQRAAADCVADWSLEARDASAAFRLIDRAFAEFRAARPRPKHIQVPISQLGRRTPPAPPPPPLPRMPGITPIGLAMMLRLLKNARKPLFIFGGGARRASDSAIRVTRKLGAAAFTTYAGRGILPPDHPLFLGATLPRAASVDLIAGADAVLAFGTELAEVDLWRDQLGHDAPLLRVDLDPAVLAGADWPVLADAADALAALDEAFEVDPPRQSDWEARDIAAFRLAARAACDSERPGLTRIVDALAAALPRDTMIFSDMTQLAYVAKEVWDMPAPDLWHHPTGFGTLGYALPAAIGGKIGRGALPVAAIAGDYGFHYTLQELGVAVELGLSLPIILWDNARLAEIGDAMQAAQIAPNAVVARNPDFCALARAWGARAVKPTDLKDMPAIMAGALNAGVPTLIHLTPDIL
ncbi:MAG: 5-guanidino-2-oxopentanoate decarboxylase [Rhodobacteraceae bacterium]|nr:5-guanidino-2-oxopentanoate decarboxylase [Paracoccaceae bacterium]